MKLLHSQTSNMGASPYMGGGNILDINLLIASGADMENCLCKYC